MIHNNLNGPVVDISMDSGARGPKWLVGPTDVLRDRVRLKGPISPSLFFSFFLFFLYTEGTYHFCMKKNEEGT